LGALLLARLLLGVSAPNLGDDFRSIRIRFQASDFSKVDDLVVTGECTGGDRMLSIGVRRSPDLTPGNDASKKLITTYVSMVIDKRVEMTNDSWRLALAVASHNEHAAQVGELAGIARSRPQSDRAFRAEVERSNRTSGAVRNRLVQLDALVAKAVASLGATDVDAGETTWRLLSSLYIHQARLEDPETDDVTVTVGQLQPKVSDGSPEAATALFHHLCVLAGEYASHGTVVDEARLRNDLRGDASLLRSDVFRHGWEVLDGYEVSLRRHTRTNLKEGRTELQLPRDNSRQELEKALWLAAMGHAVLVTGEPDVGKSALSIIAADRLKAPNLVAVLLSLRDVPATVDLLEQRLEGPLARVLAGMAVGEGRILVIDGAELVQQGRSDLFQAIVASAHSVGIGVAAVARSDARDRVENLVRRSLDVTAESEELKVHVVPGLTESEAAEVVEAFPQLQRVAVESRNEWLMARLGLLELLLPVRAATSLQDGALSEADVFEAVWKGLVRNQEDVVDGVQPDARERVLVEYARHLLDWSVPIPPLDAAALSSLRSDGLLLPWGARSAWIGEDPFASDVIRDFAVAHLLLVEGWERLLAEEDPRWALRSAILACQVRLSHTAQADRETTRRDLDIAFNAIAERHGVRWSDVPLQAILTSGFAHDLLAGAWDSLCADGRIGHLLRLAVQRHASGGAGDPFTFAPLVSVLLDRTDPTRPAIGSVSDLDVDHLARRVLLYWLSGLVQENRGSDPLRIRLRDAILDSPPEPANELATELLGLLGPDMDDRVAQLLRSISRNSPELLEPIAEHYWAARALSAHHPDLAEELFTAFYIDTNSNRGTMYYREFGLRDHEPKGLSIPMAGWHRGPFWTFLASDLLAAMRIIHRILDHATSIELRWQKAQPFDASVELELDLPGIGSRIYRGTSGTWRWYRGGVGPCVAMSALLATERAADQLVERGDSLSDVARFVIGDSESLATLGVAFGFLVRHCAVVKDELDLFLERPEVWRFECERVALEQGPHLQRTETEGIHNPELRQYLPQDVAAYLLRTSLVSGDTDRVSRLHEIGERLKQNFEQVARGTLAIGGEVDSLESATVAGWASYLQHENYSVREIPGSEDVAVLFNPPPEVSAALASDQTDIARSQQLVRLAFTYRASEGQKGPMDSLIADAELARSLIADPPIHRVQDPLDAGAAVSASLIYGHLNGLVDVTPELLSWAVRTVLDAASISTDPYAGALFDSQTSAASVAPLLLLDPDGGSTEWPDHDSATAVLRASLTSNSLAVRRAVLTHIDLLWNAECDGGSSSDAPCRHVRALRAIEDGLRDCHLGEFDYNLQGRCIELLNDPLVPNLDAALAEDLIPQRLLVPLLAVSRAATSACCISDPARELRDSALAAYRKAYFVEAPYTHMGPPETDEPLLACALFESAARGDNGPLLSHFAEVAHIPEYLPPLLREVALLTTYHADHRATLRTIWPQVIRTVLDVLDSLEQVDSQRQTRRLRNAGVAGLMLSPSPMVSEGNFGAVAEAASIDWIDPASLAGEIDRWLEYGAGDQEAVDALVAIVDTAEPMWQATTGLEWIERAIDGKYARLAGRCVRLPNWLVALSQRIEIRGESLARYSRVVDGLVASGEMRLVAIQRRHE
jgi:hypothetical protein